MHTHACMQIVPGQQEGGRRATLIPRYQVRTMFFCSYSSGTAKHSSPSTGNKRVLMSFAPSTCCFNVAQATWQKRQRISFSIPATGKSRSHVSPVLVHTASSFSCYRNCLTHLPSNTFPCWLPCFILQLFLSRDLDLTEEIKWKHCLCAQRRQAVWMGKTKDYLLQIISRQLRPWSIKAQLLSRAGIPSGKLKVLVKSVVLGSA